MTKRLVCGILCLLLGIGLAVPARAEEGTHFLRQTFQVRDGELLLYGSGVPANGTAKASVGGRPVEQVSVSTVGEEGLPVTLFCLVDYSMALEAGQFQQERDILRGLNARMGGQDNMVFAYMNESLSVGKVLADRVARDKAIRDLQPEGHHTRIHKAVNQSVEAVLRGNYGDLVCIAAFSDGMDDFKTEFNEKTVAEAIRQADIPVFGVGLIKPNPVWEDTNRAEILVHYAEASLGGKGFIPLQDGIALDDVADEIWKTIQDSPVFRIPLTGADRKGETVTVELRYTVNGVNYVQALSVNTADFPEETEAAAEAETEAASAETEETVQELAETEAAAAPEAPERNWVPIAAGAGGAVLVIVGIVLVIVSGKKKKRHAAAPVSVAPTMPVTAVGKTVPVEAGGLAKTLPLEQNLGKGGCNIRLVGENGEAETGFFLVVNEPKTLGRDQRADILLNRGDDKLSGCHVEMLWDSEMLLLRDRMSTNGTYLNGTKLQPGMWAKADPGDQLQMGSVSYRVFCQKVAGDPNLRF